MWSGIQTAAWTLTCPYLLHGYIMALYFALRLRAFVSFYPNWPSCFGTPQALFHKALITIAWTDGQKATSSCMLVGITCSLDIGCIWLTAGVSHIMN